MYEYPSLVLCKLPRPSRESQCIGKTTHSCNILYVVCPLMNGEREWKVWKMGPTLIGVAKEPDERTCRSIPSEECIPNGKSDTCGHQGVFTTVHTLFARSSSSIMLSIPSSSNRLRSDIAGLLSLVPNPVAQRRNSHNTSATTYSFIYLPSTHRQSPHRTSGCTTLVKRNTITCNNTAI